MANEAICFQSSQLGLVGCIVLLPSVIALVLHHFRCARHSRWRSQACAESPLHTFPGRATVPLHRPRPLPNGGTNSSANAATSPVVDEQVFITRTHLDAREAVRIEWELMVRLYSTHTLRLLEQEFSNNRLSAEGKHNLACLCHRIL